uniref:Uncharacterized protein n=1 Tax=Knipowitschia caucasica TaxID=637954 RepID=A0AAV2KI03_KNICA
MGITEPSVIERVVGNPHPASQPTAQRVRGNNNSDVRKKRAAGWARIPPTYTLTYTLTCTYTQTGLFDKYDYSSHLTATI